MDKISRFHRILFWLSIFPGGLFALGYYLAPVAFNAALGVETADPAAIRSIGGFLLATVTGAVLALRSGEWQEVRLFSVYVMAFNLLNGVGLTLNALTTGDLSLLPNVILLYVLGLGFAYVLFLQSRTS
jgi:hypothetical protein